MDNAIALQSLSGLQAELSRYPTGARVEAFLGVDRDLTDEDLDRMQGELERGGLRMAEPLGIGSGAWANTVRISFYNPPPVPEGIGALPLVVLLIVAVGAVGIAGILGWQVGGVIDKIGQYIIPLAILAGGVIVLVTFAKRPAGSK